MLMCLLDADPAVDIAEVRSRKKEKGNGNMDVSLILKIVGVGFLVAVASVVLNKTGRDEQAMLVTVAGVLIVMLMLIGEMGTLFETLRSVFGF